MLIKQKWVRRLFLELETGEAWAETGEDKPVRLTWITELWWMARGWERVKGRRWKANDWHALSSDNCYIDISEVALCRPSWSQWCWVGRWRTGQCNISPASPHQSHVCQGFLPSDCGVVTFYLLLSGHTTPPLPHSPTASITSKYSAVAILVRLLRIVFPSDLSASSLSSILVLSSCYPRVRIQN